MTTATPRAPRTPARAEPVGSLIRDPRIMRRLHDAYAGHTTALQSLVGDVASGPAGAGERARRRGDPRARPAPGGCGTRRRDRRRGPGPSFLHAVYDSVDGLDQAEERQVVRDEHGGGLVERFGRPVVADRIRKTSSPLAQEATFPRAITDFPLKVTLPAPSRFLSMGTSVAESEALQWRKPELLGSVAERIWGA